MIYVRGTLKKKSAPNINKFMDFILIYISDNYRKSY